MSDYKQSAKAMASAKLSRITHGHNGNASADQTGDDYGTREAGPSDSSCFKRGGAVVEGVASKQRMDRPKRGNPFVKKADGEKPAAGKGDAGRKMDTIEASSKDMKEDASSAKAMDKRPQRATGGAVGDKDDGSTPSTHGAAGDGSGDSDTTPKSGMHNDPDRARGGRTKTNKPDAYKRGGAVKKGTVVNVVVQAPGGDQSQPMPMPVPVGGPPAAPPMPMPRPQPGPPSMGAGPMGGPGPMPMRKSGGRVAMKAGADSGEGRLEKTDEAKRERAR